MNLKEFIQSQKKYDEEKELRDDLDEILGSLKKLEKFQHHLFYKTEEFNLLSSYTSYISSTETIKDIIDLIFNVKIKLTDIVLRNKLKDYKYKVKYHKKDEAILDNIVEGLEHGINSNKMLKEMNNSKKSLRISIIALISSIIVPFLLENFFR